MKKNISKVQKFLICTVVLLVIGGAGGLLYSALQRQNRVEPVLAPTVSVASQEASETEASAVSDSAAAELSSSAEPESEKPKTQTVHFSAVGDNLIHGSIYLQGQRRASGTDKQYDFTYLYADMTDFLARYDVNCINQETLISDEIAPSTYPCFCSPGEIGRAAYAAGWRVFTMSNNHIYDQGAAGIASTLRFWQSMPEDVLTTGLVQDDKLTEIPMQTVNGIKIAYLAYTEFTNGIPTPADAPARVIYTSEADIMRQQIELASQSADVVVVSVHWGVEDSHTVTDGQRTLAAQLGEWGADVILGSHPHVIQTLEELTNPDGRSTLCIYSLGNFVSAQSRPDEMIGSALTFDIVKNESGETSIQEIRVHPVVTDYGTNYSDIHVVPLYAYTPEQALAHGVRTDYPEFDYDYIRQVVSDNIPAQYLDWVD